MCFTGYHGHYRGAFSFHGMPNVVIHCHISREDELESLEQYKQHLQEELDAVEKRMKKTAKTKDAD